MLDVSRRSTFIASIAGSDMRVTDVGAGEAVLLGHSYLWDAEMWRPQIETLATRYRVIAPDLWGHGGSGPVPSGTTMRGLAEHHLALMDAMGIERFAVVGLSIGAMWGAELALVAPDRVTGVALVNGALTPEPEANRPRYDALLRAIEAAGCVPVPVADAIVPLFFSASLERRSPQLMADFGARLLRWDRDRLADSVTPLGRLIFGREDRLAAAGALKMPRLVISSGADRARSIAEGKEMAAAMNAPFLALPAAGHIASLEEPDPPVRAADAMAGRGAGAGSRIRQGLAVPRLIGRGGGDGASHHAVGMVPPSMTTSVPVMLAARSEARKAEVRDLLRRRRTADRDAAERIHDDPLAALDVGAGLARDALHEPDRPLGLDPPGSDAHDPHALGRDLLRQALAVGRQCGLCGGIRRRRLGQRQRALDRGDVDDDACPLRHHRREECAVEPHHRHQVEADLVAPGRIVQRRKSAGRRG